MSDSARVPRPVEQLIRAVAGGADPEDRDRRASTFARGLALGALVGAAIAGSTLWQRRTAQRPAPRATEPTTKPIAAPNEHGQPSQPTPPEA